MKYLLNTFLFLFAAISVFGQTMQASIGAGSSPSRVIVYIKPTTAVNGFISTFQFDVAISASISPVPTLSIVGTPAFGISWYLEPSFVEDGYRHYEFISQSNPSITIAAGVETQVIELEFFDGPITSNNVSLLTLGNFGGLTGNSLFYFTGSATSVENLLYYARGGTTVINNPSYSGPLASSATLGGILLPVTWLSFTAVKQGNNGLLNWTVANEDDNHHYELQRSTTGTDFTTIATINKSGNGVYSYTDLALNNLGSTIFFYRVKQVEISGRSGYSEIRFISFGKKGGEITVFPNPVKDGFYVNVPLTGMDKEKVKLNLFGTNGQLIITKEITGLQAANYYFSLKDIKMAAGQYSLQVILKDKTIATKMLTINQ